MPSNSFVFSGRRFNSFGAAAGPIANAHVGPAFEAIGGIGAQIEFPGGCANVLRFEAGAFQQDIGGAGIDLAVLAAHDAGQRDAFGFIGDQKHPVRQQPFFAVESDEFFALGGAANDNFRAAEQVKIKGVQRMARLQHDKIGDIDVVVNGAQADFFQSRT